MTIGKKLSNYRKLKGLTQQQLGELLCISAQAVSKWENDLAQPDLTSLKALSSIYGVTIDEMLDLGADARIGQGSDEPRTGQQSTAVNIHGFCKECGIAVTDSNLGSLTPTVRCDSCEKIFQGKLAEVKKQLETQARFAEYEKQLRLEKALRRAWCSGIAGGLAVFVLALLVPLGWWTPVIIFLAYALFAMMFMSEFKNDAVDKATDIAFFGYYVQEFGEDICDSGVGIIGIPLKIIGFFFKIIGFVLFIPVLLIASAIAFPFSVKKIIDAVNRLDYSILIDNPKYKK